MWKDSIKNIVVIFQPNILRIVGFYVRHSANKVLLYAGCELFLNLFNFVLNLFWVCFEFYKFVFQVTSDQPLLALWIRTGELDGAYWFVDESLPQASGG